MSLGYQNCRRQDWQNTNGKISFKNQSALILFYPGFATLGRMAFLNNNRKNSAILIIVLSQTASDIPRNHTTQSIHWDTKSERRFMDAISNHFIDFPKRIKKRALNRNIWLIHLSENGNISGVGWLYWFDFVIRNGIRAHCLVDDGE